MSQAFQLLVALIAPAPAMSLWAKATRTSCCSLHLMTMDHLILWMCPCWLSTCTNHAPLTILQLDRLPLCLSMEKLQQVTLRLPNRHSMHPLMNWLSHWMDALNRTLT
mmetsp:Transcript_36238/g.112614  ORF Transcript_36238/g.112614 Transcript_36238/m.112614 type:complete len:108 (-) Transcript_36238:330-653(-)